MLTAQHVIDCDSEPRGLDRGEVVVEHKKGGKLDWKNCKVVLNHPSEKGGEYLTKTGLEVREELKDVHTLNANVLDYLFEHKELIPEEWKGKLVMFWGTIYRSSEGKLFVRCIDWHAIVGWRLRTASLDMTTYWLSAACLEV